MSNKIWFRMSANWKLIQKQYFNLKKKTKRKTKIGIQLFLFFFFFNILFYYSVEYFIVDDGPDWIWMSVISIRLKHKAWILIWRINIQFPCKQPDISFGLFQFYQLRTWIRFVILLLLFRAPLYGKPNGSKLLRDINSWADSNNWSNGILWAMLCLPLMPETTKVL